MADNKQFPFPVALPTFDFSSNQPISFYIAKPIVEGMKVTGIQFQIAGGFIKTTEGDYAETPGYFGDVTLKIGTFSIRGVGGFMLDKETLSKLEGIFIYLNVHFKEKKDTPAPGYPGFRIKGIAGGFGVHTRLTLPPIQKIGDFALLPGNAPLEAKATVSPKDIGINIEAEKELPFPDPIGTVNKSLDQLIKGYLFPDEDKLQEGQEQRYIYPVILQEHGEGWGAFGVEFNSYELIDGFVMLVVNGGEYWEIDLFGHFEATFPKQVKPKGGGKIPKKLAEIKADIIASVIPSSNQFAIEGVIEDSSWVYNKKFKVSGGFAFYRWFGGPHNGDTLLTVGGYHPNFDIPDYYPRVDRLQIQFKLGNLDCAGQVYTAITNHAIMAGMKVYAHWHKGSFKAWFDIGADLLMQRVPLHYEAKVYAHIGVSAKIGFITIRRSLGVSLEIWGPDFGGKAYVEFSGLSLVISFGTDREGVKPIGWGTFRANFVPSRDADLDSDDPTPLYQATLADTADDPAEDSPYSDYIYVVSVDGKALNAQAMDVDEHDWIFDLNGFQIETQTILPSNLVTINDHFDYDHWAHIDGPGDWDSTLYIPISDEGSAHVDITHKIKVSKLVTRMPDPEPDVYEDFDHFQLSPVLNSFATDMVSNSPDGFKAPTANAPEDPDGSNPYQITKGLNGFLIGPAPSFPHYLSSIPLYQLIFQIDTNPSPFGYIQENIKSATITKTMDEEADTMKIVVSGLGHDLNNSNRILASINDSTLVDERNTLLNDLMENGFAHLDPAQIDLEILSTEKSLVDWPLVGVLGGVSV